MIRGLSISDLQETIMSTTYFGFALADGMFDVSGECMIKRQPMTIEEAKAKIEQGVDPCLNPSHAPTIDAMRQRFDINVPIPEKAPFANVNHGDSVLVMGVRGLPRLEGRHEYTEEEIKGATFKFTLYTVIPE